MKNLLTQRAASLGLIAILTSVILFHVLVLVGIIPQDIVWGGRLRTREELVEFELVSIVINFIMVLFVSVRAGIINLSIKPILIRVVLWLMVVLFILNTLGNLLSQNDMERIIFTPITLLLFVLSLRLAIEH
ncbi:MAG: hypothetical protein JNJ65_15980 [Cyclobacteriaceae bacterium]|nr:hypothetical protein [Cyclobacteriaceae bacterium]